MIKSEYHIIGCMSGTSLDGLDLAYIKFLFNEDVDFEIIHAATIEYSTEWQEKLRNLVRLSKEELKQTDNDYIAYLGQEIKTFITQNNITDIDAVCSHGHTALHVPEKGLTYQIGNLSHLAEITKNRVVCDFRVQDVKLGGQGAPLVPIGDKLLFSNYDFCLNLGGFANISFEKKYQRFAYDVCPANIILNYYAKQLGFDYDKNGDLARAGEINFELLKRLNALEYYKQPYPKSLGLEWVENYIFPMIDSYKISTYDILRTCVEHIATQLNNAIHLKSEVRVLLTGGGAFNSFLVDEFQLKSRNKIVLPEKKIIDYKEAVIFGLLGVLKLRNEINCLASVTGAEYDHSSGKIYEP